MTPELPIEARHGACIWRRREKAAAPIVRPGAQRIDEAVAEMLPEDLIEGLEPAHAVGILECHHLFQNEGMTANGTLSELDEAAGDDIGAFDSDPDRHGAIEIAEIVQRTIDDAFAAVHIHGVVD